MSEMKIVYPTAPLTEAQRQLLVSRPNRIPLEVVAGYVLAGYISLDAMPTLSEERRMQIFELQNQPDPQEVSDWMAIDSVDILTLSLDEAKDFKAKIEVYINKYSQSQPPQNHLQDAREKCQRVLERIEQFQIAGEWEKEEKAYVALDKSSYSAVIDHLRQYPHSSHFKELDDAAYYIVVFDDDYDKYLQFLKDIPNTLHKSDIDDSIWNWVKRRVSKELLEAFMHEMPWSAHYEEASQMINEYQEWSFVNTCCDLFKVKEYIDKYPSSPFKADAESKLQELRMNEVHTMRLLRDKYSYDSYCRLINEQIFTEQELMTFGVLTERVVSRLKSTSPLPDLTKHFLDGQSHFSCPSEHTDVYLFGIPSTGKTCILMSLLKGCGLDFQSKKYAGDYASDLLAYLNAGKLPKRTEGDYVAIINGEIPNDKGESHHINLIEMSGEELALGIAKNKKVKLEDFGTGTTNLLRNDNRKVFFIVFDPTVDTIRFNQTIYKKDANGDYLYDDEGKRVIDYINEELLVQSSIIQNIVDLLVLPENKDIMSKVDAIHFIATKADMLDGVGGSEDTRTDKAIELLRDQCSASVDKLKRFIRNFEGKSLNYSSDGDLHLFPFSLGQFYIGGIYEHDTTSAKEIVKVIQSVTLGKRELTWWEKFKNKLN